MGKSAIVAEAAETTQIYHFGNVEHPPFVDRPIPHATAWDDLGPRVPVGTVWHTMVGTLVGTDTYFRTGAPALTDYGIGGARDGALDGVIYRWNDPRGRRSGWANGGSNGLESIGIPFVRARGVAAINRELVSIERSDGGIESSPVSTKQARSLVQLTAHWFDVAEVPCDTFPVNPRLGLDTEFLHLHFATKGCPWSAVIALVDELNAEIEQLLRAGQRPEGEPVAPPRPPRGEGIPDSWPGGYTEDRLRARFGILERTDRETFTFNARGVISNSWAARGAEERIKAGSLPRPVKWHQLTQAGADLVEFERRWMLFRPLQGVAWRWVS